MNRVVENLRSHLDAVVIHIGNQELTDAAHSIGPATSKEGVASVAGSVATVTSRQVRMVPMSECRGSGPLAWYLRVDSEYE